MIAGRSVLSLVRSSSLLSVRSLRTATSIQQPKYTMLRPSSPSSPAAKRARENSPPLSSRNEAAAIPQEDRDAHNGTQGERKEAVDLTKQQRDLQKKLNSRYKSKRKDRQRMLERFGEEPIYYDIRDMLGSDLVNSMLAKGESVEWANKFRVGEQIEVVIERVNAHGDGLAVAPSRDWVIAIPHCLPGERVLARVYSNERFYSKGDLITILEKPAEGSQAIQRRDDLMGCKYFGECSGCQYQMIDYESQLKLKQEVVSRAFQNYSKLSSEDIPKVLPTLASPLQYNYRTKLTPHFELPKGMVRKRHKGQDAIETNGVKEVISEVQIGLNKMGGRSVLDIEECPIATKTINRALPTERQKIRDTITSFKNGATILLRDSLVTFDSPAEDRSLEIEAETESITDYRAVVKERVDNVKFETPAGTFFQNNRSILPSLLGYVKQQIQELIDKNQDNYLVDAYCGSGLFSICLAKSFKKVAGVEISSESIKFAKQNVALNNVDNVNFIAGDAQEIFKHIDFPSKQTTVILDPPRRGCDEPFIKQLLGLSPQLIIYVSCNVHTQARDVGQIVRSKQYVIKNIRGADLFPQTYHVEGVCVLQRVSM